MPSVVLVISPKIFMKWLFVFHLNIFCATINLLFQIQFSKNRKLYPMASLTHLQMSSALGFWITERLISVLRFFSYIISYCSHQLMKCLYLTYEMNFFWRNDCKTITIVVVKLLTLIEGFLCSRHCTKSFTQSHFVLTSVFCSKYYHCQFTFGKNETKFKQHDWGCTSS